MTASMRRRPAARMNDVGLVAFAFILALVAGGCAQLPEKDRSVPVPWSDVPRWEEDAHAEALPVFLRSCPKLGDAWQDACEGARALGENADDQEARNFFESYFIPHKLLREDGGDSGMITGYYEPLLEASFEPSEKYRHPIYARPADLLTVELGELYPSLDGRRVRGRIDDGAVRPYYSRAEIDGAEMPLAGGELLWAADKADVFFLHVQGSGLAQLPDGSIVGVGYAGQNGHPYRSIGRVLAERGDIPLPEVDLFSIRRWLRENPGRADELMNMNSSYVFFALREDAGEGPAGTLGVPLTPGRSLAVDPDAAELGAPVWVDSVMPGDGDAPLSRLMIAQDTGGAIRGDVRADFFWGRGTEAEASAGLMKSPGRLYVLLPMQTETE